MNRSRTEANCRNVSSKDGTFSPHLGKAITERLTRYCMDTNQNKTKFVEACISAQLDVLETKFWEGLSREQAIDLLKKSRNIH